MYTYTHAHTHKAVFHLCDLCTIVHHYNRYFISYLILWWANLWCFMCSIPHERETYYCYLLWYCGISRCDSQRSATIRWREMLWENSTSPLFVSAGNTVLLMTYWCSRYADAAAVWWMVMKQRRQSPQLMQTGIDTVAAPNRRYCAISRARLVLFIVCKIDQPHQHTAVSPPFGLKSSIASSLQSNTVHIAHYFIAFLVDTAAALLAYRHGGFVSLSSP